MKDRTATLCFTLGLVLYLIFSIALLGYSVHQMMEEAATGASGELQSLEEGSFTRSKDGEVLLYQFKKLKEQSDNREGQGL